MSSWRPPAGMTADSDPIRVRGRIGCADDGASAASSRWVPPTGMTGDLGLVRIGTGTAGDDDSCPERLAARARPRLRPQVRPSRRKPSLEDFPLDPVMQVLDSVEHRNISVAAALAELDGRRRPLHPGLASWVRQAVLAYVEGSGADAVASHPVPSHWVVQSRDPTAGRVWEMYAWGRRYQSPDGVTREFRFLRFGTATGRDRDPAQVAIAAYAASRGAPAAWPQSWGDEFDVTPTAPVERVRVVEVGCSDGSRAVLFDGTPAQADALYASHGRRRVNESVLGGTARPGPGCADCKLVTTCGALSRVPNLLGVSDPQAPLRTWSASDWRYYSACPAQEHMRRLHLPPSAAEYGPDVTRGRAVHAWLQALHSRCPYVQCLTADVPESADDWSAGGWHVAGEQALNGSRMIEAHAQTCPFQIGDQITDARPEPVLAFHDTAASVIVIAKPDLIYMDDGSWVWRETKTASRSSRQNRDLLRAFPQLALGVLILHHNLLGGDPSGSRVELEILGPRRPDIILIDPADSEQAAQAHEVISVVAGQWRKDEAFPAQPGSHCRTCAVSQWCPDFPAADADAAPGHLPIPSNRLWSIQP